MAVGTVNSYSGLLLLVIDCENKAGDDKCYADASVGECESNTEYMLENCAKACAKCKYNK